MGHFSGKLGAQTAAFEKITIAQGLSQGMVRDILQTHDGFLWVATKDGLNRYDGYNFKVFSNNPFDSLSISSNTATKLFEDSRNWLWIGLEGKGVDVYDPKTGSFRHIPLHFSANKDAPFLRVRAIQEDKHGAIWVLSGKSALTRIAIPNQWRDLTDWSKTVEIGNIAFEGWEQGKGDIVYFSLEADGDAVLFSNTGQFRVEAGSNTAKPLQSIKWPSTIRNVMPSAAGGQAGWWLLDEQYRLYWLDDKGLVAVQPQVQESKQQAYLDMDSRGKTWLTLDGRIWQLHNAAQLIDLDKPDWTLDREATSVQSDQNGNIWAGTSGYGLRKINPDIQLFHSGAAGQSVWRLWRSPQGHYYVRNGLVKLFPYDPNTGKLGETPAFPALGDKGKRDICFEPSGAFWVLASRPEAYSPGGFLCRFDRTETLLQTYPFDFNGYDYARLLLDRDGYVWATGARCQLVRFDPRSARFDYFDYSTLFGKDAETVQPLDIVQDGNGTIWIGTRKGLVRCVTNGKNLGFQLVQTNPRNPNGLNHNSIACLLPDPVRPDALLWIGTKGGGLNCLDLRSGQVQHLTVADGFPDQVVYGILPGNENPATGLVSLWCSTNRGLVKVTPRGAPPFSFDLVRYSVAQGLQDEEFNTQSYFKAANGELLFGGVNGLNHFFPEKLFADTVVPPVSIVGLEINHHRADVRNAKYPLAVPLEHLRKLELPHDQNNVSFEFAALDFTDPSRNRYRYRLVGLDADWVETGNHRFAHFSHLAPGSYELWVQGSNGESTWQDAPPLAIVVHPPWYRSNLAYLCYFLLLAWGAWKAQQLQIQRVREREQLAFEHRETERVKALEQMKTNFFSNVTHEFRTPLTLMIEPLRQFLKNPKDPGSVEKVRLAEKNSRQLLGLVNQLLDMAKLESGQMSLDLRRGNLVQTVRDVFEAFLPLAEKRGVKLVFRQDSKDLQDFNFDPDKMEQILNNLISNALKFTPEGGRVDIKVYDLRLTKGAPNLAVVEGENPKSEIRNPKSKGAPDLAAVEGENPKSEIRHPTSNIAIQVKDTGIGIPADALPKVFDRFYQVDGSHTRRGEGTGIGLSLTKELIELMGGGIAVESEVGKGSTFTVWIPVQLTIYDLRFTIGTPDLGDENPKSEIQNPKSNDTPDLADMADEIPKSEIQNPKSNVVLIVEDNAELRQFVAQSIGGAGWQVVEASDGEEGIQKAINLLPDLVVSDLMMPRKDGLAVLDTLKQAELTAHIPIILLTSKSGVESRLAGLRRGADDYLTKPFSTEELLARMENLVETRRRLRALFGKQLGFTPHVGDTGLPQDRLSEPFLSTPDRDFLQKFNLLLEQHLSDEHITVEDFAHKMAVSRMQLHRKLTALTDQNVTMYVRNYRLERAMRLLQNREGNVAQVASWVGFGSEKYFSTAFKEKFRVSPSQV